MPYITNIPNIATELTDTTEFAVSQGATAGDQKKITGAVIKSYMTTAAGKTAANDIGAATGATTADKIKATIGDATTSAKGVVQLAATGVESATKVPKATGAEIAALLTAGGYTLTAPSGSNSLDGIADTATWKKVAAAVAAALNAGNHVAQSGITDLHGITGECWFSTADSPANRPGTLTFFFGFQRYFAANPDFREVVVWEVATGIQYREVMQGGVWQGWKTVWDSYSDGNGGQPPAPKPQNTAETQGQWKAVQNGDNVELKSPNVANSTWAYHLILYNTSTGKLENGNFGASIVSGNTSIYPAVVGISSLCFFWRIA